MAQSTKRIINFGAGPAKLPEKVLEQVRDELMDCGCGVSVMELSHRSPEYMAINNRAIDLYRELLSETHSKGFVTTTSRRHEMQLAARRIRWMCLLCACALADQRVVVNTAGDNGTTTAVQTGLGEQCFQDDTCQMQDKHAVCAQVDHNALCKCKQGYHIVTVSRPTNARSSFCAQDETDGRGGGSSLLGVVVGLLVFSALICFGLRLSTASRPRHFPTTNLYPNKLLCSRQTKASSSKHYGTSDSAIANGQQEEESSAGQSETKDDDTSRVGAARAAAFILISCRPSTSELPTASPSKAKRAKKLGYGRTGSDPAVHSSSSMKTYNFKWYQRDQHRRHSTKNREAKGTPPSHCSTEQLIQNYSKENSRNSQSTLNSKDKSKASSVSRIEHKAQVHHSAASSSSPDPTVVTIELPEQEHGEDTTQGLQ